MNRYNPPINITPEILQWVAEICELLGRWSASPQASSPQLRRNNRIRTIQASLAIENNTLTLEQVTAVLNGKRVLGLPREIQEVRNAFSAYEAMEKWQPESPENILEAHKLLMMGLVDELGQFRSGGVGINRGQELVHMAPPAQRVPTLIHNLCAWLARAEVHPLIASSVFHYEFEFIHPFVDGNGRMGRLWQTLILSRWQPVLAYLPVETVIHERQEAYCQALAEADKAADTAPFVIFMLRALHGAMIDVLAGKSSEKSSEKSSGKSSEKSSEKILALLEVEPTLSAKEIAARLEISARAVEKQITNLKNKNRLRRVGTAKGGYWQAL